MELGLAYVDIDAETLSRIRDLGVSTLYNSIRWCNVQPQAPEQFIWDSYDFYIDQENSNGISSVRSISHTPQWASHGDEYPYWSHPPEDLTHWVRFIKELVLRYPGRTWTIWAEPDNYPPREANNLICFTGDAIAYGEMLKHAYITAKDNDPSCVVGIGGLVGATINGSFPYEVFNGVCEDRLVFLEKLVANGYLDYCDFVGADCYAFGYGGTKNIRNGLHKIRKITKRKSIWIMETGTKLTRTDKIDEKIYKQTYGHEAVTQETAAGLILSVCKIAEEFYVPKIFWVTLRSSDWGLINRLGEKHLAYDMFKLISRSHLGQSASKEDK